MDISHSQEIYTVSQLNREIKLLLEGSFGALWVEGEISNFSMPSSGHWYFSLKDATAQVRCAMFKPQNRRLTLTPKDGMRVFAKARVSLYEGRGDFQLLIEHMEEAGVGKLRQEFEALKKRLQEAGLFDAIHKKPLPAFPNQIGVITSATGAAIRDILTALRRRYPIAPVIIYPTLVQGDTAAPAIVAAIQTANRRNECDVLLLTRGGGSLEDLWPFNDERVALAIHHSNIPIISGVGHEVDVTIADFVADVRAATPTAAAELATPDRTELLRTFNDAEKHVLRTMQKMLQHLQQQLHWTGKQLQMQHPKKRLAEQTQRLDYFEITLMRLQQKILRDRASTLQTMQARLAGITPNHLIRHLRHQLHLQQQQMMNVMRESLQKKQQILVNAATKLDALSPLATLTRGFAIVTERKTHRVVQDARQVKVGDIVDVRLKQGTLECEVK